MWDAGPLSITTAGEVFSDRFHVHKELGSGGMGVVYLVEEKSTSMRFALKALKPELTQNAAAKSRFEREIRILAKIRHPSIPRIIEWGTFEDSMFFVSEFVEGETLKDLLKRKRRLETTEAVPLIVAAAEALGSAHQAGVVHRDIKPSNIMVASSGSVYLIDFGVARSTSAELTQLTTTGLFVGTPQYMSPEQLDSRRADERSDIYSMGVVLYEILTGRLPFSGDSPMAIATQHMNDEPISPRLVAPSVPFWLERIILRCLEKDPSNRFWTVNELLTELRKSHARARVMKRTLANGDVVTEDPAAQQGFILSVLSDREKVGWSPSISLYYKDTFYKIRAVEPPSGPRTRWEYRFELWPDNEVMRRVIDYEAEVSVQNAKASILSRARKWIGS